MRTTDAELLRATDARAFGELYGRHATAVHEWFARRVAWAAADLTAETFARAWLSRVRRDGREAFKIAADARGTHVHIVDARTYNPIEFRTRGTGGGTVLRFVTYERLPLTDDSRALLSIAAQHGDAPVVRDAAAYRAAVAKAFPNG